MKVGFEYNQGEYLLKISAQNDTEGLALSSWVEKNRDNHGNLKTENMIFQSREPIEYVNKIIG